MVETEYEFELEPSGSEAFAEHDYDILNGFDEDEDDHEILPEGFDQKDRFTEDIQYNMEAIDPGSSDTLLEDDEDTGGVSDGDEDESRDEALECLEDFVLSLLTKLLDALPSAYSQSEARKGSGKKLVLHIADRTKEPSDNQIPTRAFVFPRHSRGPSAKPFAQLFKVVDLMHEALVDGIPMTKRDMYYRDVQLFRSQATVDRLVDDLSATLHLSRADLNVRASPKGLICGSGLTMYMKSGESLEVNHTEASLIPQSEDIERFEVTETMSWVLIVEKEAVFQTLCMLRLATHEALPGPGVIVTGKGYPDVATRQLVKTLSDNLSSRIPILALVDGDAYGIDILSVYKHGSTRMRHENEHLAAARVQWVGLWASELAALGIDKDVLLPITNHDEKKARTLLKRTNLPAQWRKELQCMLFSRRKAEIEVLGAARAPTDSVADLGTAAYDRPREGGRSGIPLLRYLVQKIRTACACADDRVPH